MASADRKSSSDPVEPDVLPLGEPATDLSAEVVRWLFPAYIFLMLLAFFALRAEGVKPAGNQLTHDRAVFTAVNAATLTGFQLNDHPTRFFLPGKVILLLLTVAGTLFSLIVGSLAVKRILGLTWPDRRIVVAAFTLQASVLIVGAMAGVGRNNNTTLGAMLQAAAAFANSGLYVDAPPGVREGYTHLVLLPLSVVGGLGLVVVLELYDCLLGGRPLSRHTQVVLRTSAALYVIGFVAFAVLQFIDLEALGQRRNEGFFAAARRLWPAAWPDALVGASTTSLNARTAGMNILPVYGFPRAMAFFTVLLMAVGASPGGTGGGLKTTTLWELFRAPRRVLTGRPLSRATGIAAAWLGFYAIAVAVFYMLLLTCEPQMPGDRVLFVTVSALSNVGLSHDVLSMTRSSLYLVSAAMFVGRLAPLLILWWMADTTREAEVAIG